MRLTSRFRVFVLVFDLCKNHSLSSAPKTEVQRPKIVFLT
jgi:hypothetical protein